MCNVDCISAFLERGNVNRTNGRAVGRQMGLPVEMGLVGPWRVTV